MERRDLQKILEFAQMDLSKKTPKTHGKIMDDLLERFAKNEIQVECLNRKYPLDKLEEMQEYLQPIIEMLKTPGSDQVEFSPELHFMVVNKKVVTYTFFEDQLLVSLFTLIDGLDTDELLVCPQCGNLFIGVGKRVKIYCSNRCGTDAFLERKTPTKG
jgi:hypothetical protein